MTSLTEDLRNRLADIDFCEITYNVVPFDGVGHQTGSERYRLRRTYEAL